MSQPVSAAIHIQGSTIRCAEIVQRNAAPDLRRFGQRTFEFDVAQVLWEGAGTNDSLSRVAAAVENTLEGTEASEVRVVLHPLDVFSFFTPVSAELSERDRMHHVIQQAALLAGTRSPTSLRITPRAVRTVDHGNGELIEWIHVLAVPKEIKERIEVLLDSISVQDHVQIVSSEAVARLVAFVKEKELASASPSSAPYSLALGQYPTHTEFSLTYNQAWHHALATREAQSDENRVYYAVGFLNRAGIPLKEIGRLFVYGTEVDRDAFGPFESIFSCESERLDPFQVLRRFPEPPDEGAPGSYAPCIGGALEAAT